MAEKLKSDADHCIILEKEYRARQTDLEKAVAVAKAARTAMRTAKEELLQAEQIAAGKPFMLRRKYPKFAPLDRMWSVEDTYLDLAASAADVTEYFRVQEDREVERLFCSQFQNPGRPAAVGDHLAQWAKLNRLSGLAMKYVMGHLWPGRSEPKSYFSLVQQFLDTVPRINAMKRSACIEGARMALARVKTYWAEMKATDVASLGLLVGTSATNS